MHYNSRRMRRTRLHTDPKGLFLHDLLLQSCQKFGSKTALVDTSTDPVRRISFAEYGEIVERVARNLVAQGLKPGEVIGIYLPNCWEYSVVYHAATLAGGIPTLLNPSYREREVQYQLETAEAVFLVTNAVSIVEINLQGLLNLRKVFSTRTDGHATTAFSELLKTTSAALPAPAAAAEDTLAALPFSSGTTGLPKGVMLTHTNLVTNLYQMQVFGEAQGLREIDRTLCFLPLYHIFGLNVVLNPALVLGVSNILMPRFDMQLVLRCLMEEQITLFSLVPAVMQGLCQAAEQGLFPRNHSLRFVHTGAAPLAAKLPKHFTSLTGVTVTQGYGMTEASPATHTGYVEPERNCPEGIGHPLALTDCRLVDEAGNDVMSGEPGELIMRGPQFMKGYWKAPDATAAALRDGWYWSGDVAVTDEEGRYRIVDRRKEMIKYKGFPIAPAEVEGVLLEHPAVLDCGVVGRPDETAGEIPTAFVVLKEGFDGGGKLGDELCGYVAEKLTGYKQPREVKFVSAIPRNPSGKILRKDLKSQL